MVWRARAGADISNWPVSTLVCGGYLELVKLAISKGATDFKSGACEGRSHKAQTTFNRALHYACKGGNRELAEFMIVVYLVRAAVDIIELAEIILLKGDANVKVGLSGACCGGHLKRAERMIFTRRERLQFEFERRV